MNAAATVFAVAIDASARILGAIKKFSLHANLLLMNFLMSSHNHLTLSSTQRFSSSDPPPRPSHRPVSQIAPVEQSPSPAKSLGGPSKSSSLPITANPQPPAPVVAPPVEPGVSAGELAELRAELTSRLDREVSELRSELERVRSGLTARVHALSAEVDEEKRLRASAQVELERVRKLLQERELGPVSLAPAGRSSNA